MSSLSSKKKSSSRVVLMAEDTAATDAPATQSSSSLSYYYTNRHQQALELELSIWNSILHRNKYAHNKTQYHRRMFMALRACNKLTKNLYHDYNELFGVGNSESNGGGKLVRILQYEQEQKQKLKVQQEIFWELKMDDTATIARKDEKNDDHLSKLVNEICQFRHVVTIGIDDVISRIEYAAQYCFDEEIARGFFLPYITILVGCSARIHNLLLRFRNFVIQEIRMQFVDSSSLLWNQTNNNNEFAKKIKYELDRFVVMEKKQADNNDFYKLPTRTERTMTSLRSLGIAIPRSWTINDTTLDDDDDDSTRIQEEESEPQPANKDDDDLGETLVEQPTVAAEPAPVTNIQPATESSLSPDLLLAAALLAPDDVDQNETLVESFKNKNKKRKAEEDGSSTNKKEAEKKSKKKKKRTDNKKRKKNEEKGGDFFDNLFG